MKYLTLISFFFLLSLPAKGIDSDPHIIYSKISLDKKFKASLVYDNYKLWYALAIYKLEPAQNKLIYISKITENYHNKIKFKFTKDSKYLLFETESNEKHSVYDLYKRTTINHDIKLNLKDE